MKKLFFFLYAFCTPLLLFGMDDAVLSLEQCIALAKQNSRALKGASFRIESAIADKNSARALLLPNLNVQGVLAGRHSGWGFFPDNSYGVTQFVPSQSIGVEANILLFDFFKSWNKLAAKRIAVEISESRKRAEEQGIEEDVKKWYFKILEDQEWATLLENSIKTLGQQVKSSQDLFKEGVVGKGDLLATEVTLANKQKDLLRARNELRISYMRLNRLISRNLFSKIALQDVSTFPMICLQTDELFLLALSQREDLKISKKEMEVLDKQATAAIRELAPKIAASASYRYSHDTNRFNKDELSGAISITFPLYDGGKSRAESNKFKAEKKAVEQFIEDKKENIRIDIENAVAILEESKIAYDLDKKAIESGEENLKINQDQYKEGLTSINDILRAEDQLSSARLNQKKNFYRYHKEIANLQKITGGFPL